MIFLTIFPKLFLIKIESKIANLAKTNTEVSFEQQQKKSRAFQGFILRRGGGVGGGKITPRLTLAKMTPET